MQGAYGIDFGSSRTVMGAATKGGVKILINEGSNRETGNYISFGAKQRFIGETGQAQKMSNFKNTVNFFNRFLGMTTSDPYFNQESQFITVQTVQNQEEVEFQVNYQNNMISLSPQQLTAAFLGKIQKQIEKEGFEKVKDMVISVPSYYNEKERKALLDACKIAEINVTRLFNESSAVALSYGIFRRNDLTTTAKNVIFVDFGHSKLSVYCAAFTKEKCIILAEEHARHVGCRNIDYEILKHFCNKFNTDKGINPIKNVKARLRMLDAIEKLRKVLSANNEAQISIECLLEDEDMFYNLTRDEFEALIQDYLVIMRNVLQSFFKTLETKNIKYSDVEIIGGGSRIPSVQAMIMETFKCEVIMRTLNSSECIARGCALMSAMMSPLFKVANYGVEEYNLHPIRINYQHVNPNKMEIENEKSELKSALLFPEGCNLQSIKSISFSKPDSVSVQIQYDNQNLNLCQYQLTPGEIKEKEFKQKIRIKLDMNGIVAITEYSLEETYEEIVEPEKKENKEEKKDDKENPQTEVKPEIKKKTKTKILQFQPSYFNQYTDECLKQLFEIEVQMRHNDNLVLETLEKKNDLEAYIYNMRSCLNNEYKNFIQAEKIPGYLEQLQQEENWLYEEGYNAQKSEYVKRINKLKIIGDPIQNRYVENNIQPDIIKQLENCIKKYYDLANHKGEDYSHITEQEKNSVIERCNDIQNFLKQNQEKQSQSPLYFDLIVSNADLNKKASEFEQFAANIMNKKKPKVEPKVEPKEEPKVETKPEQNDQEAKNNQEQKNDNPQSMEIE